MKSIKIGMIGSGSAAHLHCEAYRRVHGFLLELRLVASLDKSSEVFAQQYGFAKVYQDYREMLNDPEIDVVDIIVPPALHKQCIVDSINAGKHVICEKPLTGYFGEAGDLDPIGKHVDRKHMLESVLTDMYDISILLEQSNKHFMYAENWVYAPSVQKAAEIVREKKLKQLFLRGEESHSGSRAAHAAHFNQNGGGSLIRQGCHPISAILYLKQVEAQARGEEICIESVMCDTGDISNRLSDEDKKHIASRPSDVEDYAQCIITFTDGTKADIVSTDLLLGGVKNRLEIYANEAVLNCNISPNNAMQSYFTSESGLENVSLTEKAQTKLGWQSIFLEESFSRGYVGELQDFMESIVYGRKPQSDFNLAYETTKVVYAAYLSAWEGRRVTFDRK